MPRFAANLSMMYAEHAVPRSLRRGRGATASRRSSTSSPTSAPAATLAARCTTTACSRCSSTRRRATSPSGERGIACLPGREAEFRERLRARPRLRRGARLPARARDGRARAAPAPTARRCGRPMSRNLALGGAKRAAQAGVDVLIEPINTRDIPGYFLNRQDEAHAVVAEIGAPQPQGADGPVPLPDRRGRRRDEAARVPADRQGRPPPDRRRARAARARRRRDRTTRTCSTSIDALGYDGWIGCEYRPAGGDVRTAWAGCVGAEGGGAPLAVVETRLRQGRDAIGAGRREEVDDLLRRVA